MTDYRLSPEITNQGQVRFAELMSAQTLMAKREASEAITASLLYSYASGALAFPQQKLEQALGRDITLRRIYKAMVSKTAAFYLPEALAASSDVLPTREGEGCRVRMQESRAEPDQVYIIIELTRNREATPNALMVCGAGDQIAQTALPASRNGVIQVIVEKTSEILTLLADPKSEVFVR